MAQGAQAADAPAAAATPGGKAVLARQAHYKDLNAAFRGLAGELGKDAPDKALISTNGAKIKALVEDLPTWFPKGSGPEAGVPTRAKAEIWTDAAGFATAATNLRTETAKLADAATAGDIDALKAQAKAVNGACKACHDTYRGPEAH